MEMIRRNRRLILDEKDVTCVLEGINSVCSCNVRVVDYGWHEHPDMWAIEFQANEGRYNRIIANLLLIGKFEYVARTIGKVRIAELRFKKNEGRA